MKIDIKRNQRIKLILDLINKRRKINPEQEVFQFQYKELTKLKPLEDQLILNQILKKIQEESGCITVYFPETPEHLKGKPLIDERSETAAIAQILYKGKGAVTLSKEMIDSFSAIAIHIENFDKFNEYYKHITEKKELLIGGIKTEPTFKENSGTIKIGNKECEIPLNTYQYFLCKAIFDVPLGTRVKEVDVLDLIDSAKDTRRSIYDAAMAVNAKIEKKLGIKKFLCWRNNHIWINDKLFDL